MSLRVDSPSSCNYSIAIVGGGIGGLCTAIGLVRHGVRVEIYEAAPAFSEIGAGVAMGPNATRAMELIDPAIYAGFSKIRSFHAWPGREKFWFSFRTGDDPHNAEFGTHFHDQMCEIGQPSVHRARFLEELVALLPKEIAHFGKKLADIDDRGNSVVLKFEDGTIAEHSAVIGCDGIRSVTREVLFGRDDPVARAVFSGKYAYRGLVPMDEAAKVLGDELARNPQVYVGHGGHLLTFPIEKGKTLNVVAFGTKEDGRWDDAEWIKPMDREAMFKDFDGWITPIQKILGLLTKSDVWALFDHPPAPTYFKGRVCLLGDAAHASTPHNGAGAGQAIEDALIMTQALSIVRDNKDITKSFAIFDRLRRPRSQWQVRDARLNGLNYDMEAPGVGDDLDKIRDKVAARVKQIWEHDLDADVEEAARLFQLDGMPPVLPPIEA